MVQQEFKGLLETTVLLDPLVIKAFKERLA